MSALFETIGLILLTALAMAPVLAARRRNPRPVSSVIPVFASVAALVGIGAGWVKTRDARSAKATPPTNRPMEQPLEGFVTSDNCRSCHPNAYDTWHASYHRTMTQLASAESIKGDFEGFEMKYEGAVFKMQRRGEEYWIDMPALTLIGKPDPSGKRMERKIEMVTGSHNYQVYWFSSGYTARMDQFPLVWLIGDRRWIPRNSSFLVPPDQSISLEEGRWNDGCIQCHTTGYKPNHKNAYEMYSTVTEFGISCEACHGPAEDHVAINSGPAQRYRNHTDDKDDQSAKNPTKLGSPLDSQVCGQCHSINVESSVQKLAEWKEVGYRYRPGDDLHKDRDIIRLTDEELVAEYGGESIQFFRNYFWKDGMVRVAGRDYTALLDTPCFNDGHPGGMSCFSCHQMHPPKDSGRDLAEWRDDQLKPGMRGNDACLQCHGEIGDNLVAHTHHPAETAGSLCYNCHMPHTTYGLLKAVRSHLVNSPSAQESIETGRPNACNLCHLDKTLEWTADNLLDLYGIPSPNLTGEQRNVAASLTWTLSGDAGQRALMAWGLSWKPALEISGNHWQVPALAKLLEDPYTAVRIIAANSLRSFRGFQSFEFDQELPLERRREISRAVVERWSEQNAATASSEIGEPGLSQTLLTAPGKTDAKMYRELLGRRDNTPIMLSE